VERQEQKKIYGGKPAATWKRDFGQLNADIKAAEDQRSELKERMKDTSKMSRGEYVSIQRGVNSAEARLQRLNGKLDALTEEANKFNVPADLRQ
jgi:predicted  nucleic acid-binding Zn-ribbon protein